VILVVSVVLCKDDTDCGREGAANVGKQGGGGRVGSDSFRHCSHMSVGVCCDKSQVWCEIQRFKTGQIISALPDSHLALRFVLED